METITESEYLDGVVTGHVQPGVDQPSLSGSTISSVTGKSTVGDDKVMSEPTNNCSVTLTSVGSEQNPFIGK